MKKKETLVQHGEVVNVPLEKRGYSEPTVTPINEPKEKKNNTKLIIAIVLLVLVIATIAYLNYRQKHEQN